MADDLARSRVKALAFDDSVFFDLITQHEERREGVGELEDADRGDETRQVAELRNGGRYNKGDAPIKRHEDDPADLAGLGGEAGEAEEIDEEVIVDDFEADVAVENSGDEAGDELDGVGDDGPGVVGDALVGGVDGELALEGVDEEAEEHVEEVDEKLGEEHALPEIEGALHLRHEFHEQHGAAVRVDGLHEPDDLEGEGGAGPLAGGRHDGLVGGDAFVLGHGCVDEDAGVGDDAHGEEDDEQVHPDGRVGEPAEALQRADLAEEHAGDGLGGEKGRGISNHWVCFAESGIPRSEDGVWGGRKGKGKIKDLPKRNTG